LVVAGASVATVEVADDNDRSSDCAALDGAMLSNPKPNADTATSAMRLRSVFVDICFLSISQSREFPNLGFE
jgi:hypothetical protein